MKEESKQEKQTSKVSVETVQDKKAQGTQIPSPGPTISVNIIQNIEFDGHDLASDYLKGAPEKPVMDLNQDELYDLAKALVLREKTDYYVVSVTKVSGSNSAKKEGH